jgi:hypothetical protein
MASPPRHISGLLLLALQVLFACTAPTLPWQRDVTSEVVEARSDRDQSQGDILSAADSADIGDASQQPAPSALRSDMGGRGPLVLEESFVVEDCSSFEPGFPSQFADPTTIRSSTTAFLSLVTQHVRLQI